MNIRILLVLISIYAVPVHAMARLRSLFRKPVAPRFAYAIAGAGIMASQQKKQVQGVPVQKLPVQQLQKQRKESWIDRYAWAFAMPFAGELGSPFAKEIINSDDPDLSKAAQHVDLEQACKEGAKGVFTRAVMDGTRASSRWLGSEFLGQDFVDEVILPVEGTIAKVALTETLHQFTGSPRMPARTIGESLATDYIYHYGKKGIEKYVWGSEIRCPKIGSGYWGMHARDFIEAQAKKNTKFFIQNAVFGKPTKVGVGISIGDE